MRTLGILLILLVQFLHVRAAEVPQTLEAQLLSDFIEAHRLSWNIKGSERAEEIRTMSEEMVTYLKETEPALFASPVNALSVDETNTVFRKLLSLEAKGFNGDEREAERYLMRFPIWRVYIPLWKDGKMSIQQRVFFVYFIRTLVNEYQERDERRRKSATEEKRANKAPEPTPGAVTPRATEGASK